jgi:hypothetical protein
MTSFPSLGLTIDDLVGRDGLFCQKSCKTRVAGQVRGERQTNGLIKTGKEEGFWIIRNSFGNKIIGKSIKCELKISATDINPFSIKKIIPPYYFYFKDSKTLINYYLHRTQGVLKISSVKLNFNEKKSRIDIEYLGSISKDNFLLFTRRSKRKFYCSYLSSPKEMIEDLKKFIKKIDP